MKRNNVGTVMNRKATAIERLCYVLNDEVYRMKQHLEGRFLTLADASFFDKEQRDAFKSMIRQIIWDQYCPEFGNILDQWADKFGKEEIIPTELYTNRGVSKPTQNYFPE